MSIGPLQKPPDAASEKEYQKGYSDYLRTPNDPKWKDATADAWVGVGVMDGIAKKKPRTGSLGPKPTGRFGDNYSASYAGIKSGLRNGYPLPVAPSMAASPESFWSDQGALDAISGSDHRLGLETSVETETKITVVSPTGEVSVSPVTASTAADYPESFKFYKKGLPSGGNEGFNPQQALVMMMMYRMFSNGGNSSAPARKPKKRRK
jgi:hypothetical protein